MVDNSFYQENELFSEPCRIYTAGQNEKGYPRLFGRFADGVQVWLGHRLAWFYANNVSASEMLDKYSNVDLDHMCQNKSCFEPSHMQWLDRSSHSKLTWDRYTHDEKAQRLMRGLLGRLSEPTSGTFEWNGHRVTIEPV